MRTRTILYTGKGGVGKTSVAACTGRACASSGLRTLVISTDPAHSLSESLCEEVGGTPTRVSPRLWGQEVDAQAELERHWSGVQQWLGELLIDCAPTGETLRLLSFPDVARWWIQKVFPLERQILAAARPIAASVLDIPLPGHAVFADIHRLSENMIAMNEILRDHELCTVRLVMNPDKMVIGEAMRTFTYLNLYGYLADAVVVNRVFPAEVGDYFAAWRTLQEEHLELVRSAFAPVPVLCAPYFEQEVVGGEMLDRLATALFAQHNPAAVLHDAPVQKIEMLDGGARLRLELPFSRKSEISLKQRGLELIVGVDGQRRTIALPTALAALRATQASFEDGALEVSFDAR
ncbi:MAG: ArsA family ATPase [Actinobacteria bacterium]|nr:MAG: ArsA family ATPase [Actinomycetota bacterium]